ncbi:pyridoxal 5'-phosphate synthase glutaminase subunit PdxT, partial [bacterium]
TLGSLNVRVARNAYGAQIDSFETDLPVEELGESVRAVFIRAPQIKEVGEGVEVLARYEGAPVLVRQGGIVALSFHPEIAGEGRIHQLWLDGLSAQKGRVPVSSEAAQ